MVRIILGLAALFGVTLVASSATAQEEPTDVTFEGPIELTQTLLTPSSGFEIGPGSIRVTLTPALDGVLRAEVENLRVFSGDGSLGLSWERFYSDENYYWPPVAIEDNMFELSFGLSRNVVGSFQRPSVTIVGEIVSNSELRGTLQQSETEPASTVWSATGPTDTPPGPTDSLFHGAVVGGGSVTVALEAKTYRITSFDLRDVPLDPCIPGQTLSVHGFFDHDRGGGILGDSAIFVGGLVVGITVTEVDQRSASGMLFLRDGIYADDCTLRPGWQTEPFTNATMEPSAVIEPTPTVGPGVLPPTGGGGRAGTQSLLWILGLASAGAALAAAGAKARHTS